MHCLGSGSDGYLHASQCYLHAQRCAAAVASQLQCQQLSGKKAQSCLAKKPPKFNPRQQQQTNDIETKNAPNADENVHKNILKQHLIVHKKSTIPANSQRDHNGSRQLTAARNICVESCDACSQCGKQTAVCLQVDTNNSSHGGNIVEATTKGCIEQKDNKLSYQRSSTNNDDKNSLSSLYCSSSASLKPVTATAFRARNQNQSSTSLISNAITLVAIYLLVLKHAPHQGSKVGLVQCLGDDYNFNYPPHLTPAHMTPLLSHHNPFTMLDSDSSMSSSSTIGSDELSRGFIGGASDLSVPTQPDLLVQSPTMVSQDTLDTHIRNILVPRVSGTSGNINVRNYIVNILRANSYHVELDEFSDSTPIGPVQFANIIASNNPNACKQLVVACHYDSKYMHNFLGATDSAVPCAMLLHMAETLRDTFRPNSSASNQLGIRFVFFDGEEAFHEWSATDSLYGSRHLAAKWAVQQPPVAATSKQCGGNQLATTGSDNELSRIELFVLLDLIGARDSSFVLYNSANRRNWNELRRLESSYLNAGKLLNSLGNRRQVAFKSSYMPLALVEDDHVPFQKRNVPVLLLLSHPFPSVWHTTSDNYDAIDFGRTRRILAVLEQFVANFLISSQSREPTQRHRNSRRGTD